jgi:hypothetical protein
LTVNPRAIIAVVVLVLAGAASAFGLAGSVTSSLAQGATLQEGDVQRHDMTPMERYRAASKDAADELKEALAACRQVEKSARSRCARMAREQQRTTVVQANTRIRLELANSRGLARTASN